MSKEIPTCYKCGKIALTLQGIIYYRAKVDDKWGSHPICDNCYSIEEPNRIPVRMKAECFDLK